MIDKKVIFIRKKWVSNIGWSDSISFFYDKVKEISHESHIMEVDTSGIKNIYHSNIKLISLLNYEKKLNNVILIINHSICFWALYPTLRKLKKRGVSIILAMHEHEHILGISFFFKNKKNISLKEGIRYLPIYHKIPANFSNHVFVLAEAQAKVLNISNYTRCNFLPVKSHLFPADFKKNQYSPRILFAHDPKRFDKGYRFIESIKKVIKKDVTWKIGRQENLPFNMVYLKYWNSDIVIIPSDWESYSQVFIEAMACNKILVCSPHIGALKIIHAKHDKNHLEKIGIFVSNHDEASYAKELNKAISFHYSKNEVKTLEIYNEFNFNDSNFPIEILK